MDHFTHFTKRNQEILCYPVWTPYLITGGVEVVSRRDQEIKYVNGLMERGREERVGLESAAGKGELVPSTPQRYINAGWLLCPSLLGYNDCQEYAS